MKPILQPIAVLMRPLCLLVVVIQLSSCSTRTKIGQESAAAWSLSKFDENYRSSSSSESEAVKINGMKGFMRKGYAEEKTGIYTMEPFDPAKIPVLFIHGLFSQPNTWRDMAENLHSDPEIAKRYQFWFYAYPSATPIVPSAAILKFHLDAAIEKIEKDFGVSMERRLVVIGHSMGGMLTKSLVSSTGDKLWNGVFNAPLEKFDLNDRQKMLLGSGFRYEPRSYVNTAIFIAAPQRGSEIANSAMGKTRNQALGKTTGSRTISHSLGHEEPRPAQARFLRVRREQGELDLNAQTRFTSDSHACRSTYRSRSDLPHAGGTKAQTLQSQ